MEKERIKIEIYDQKFKTYGWHQKSNDWVLFNVIQRKSGALTLEDARQIIQGIMEAMEVPVSMNDCDVEVQDMRDEKSAAENELAAIKRESSGQMIH